MRQRLVATGMILVLFLMSTCGCVQNSSEKQKFIGTWVTEVKINPMDGSNYTDTVIFYDNGSYATTTVGIHHILGNWSLRNGKLLIDTYYPGAYQYVFSKNNTVLTLTPVAGGAVETLTKQ